MDIRNNNLFELSFIIISFLSICVSTYFIYIYSPIEEILGIPQKIFYFHVSFAWWAFLSFFMVCIFGTLYLIKRKLIYIRRSIAFAEVGVLYSTLVLITGIIWARASWNTFWTWDPRLITTLIMWFMYVLYLVIMYMDIQEEKKYAFCSVLGIVAFIDVPIVFWSARMWRSIHPAVFASKGGGMPKEMLYTMFINLFAYGVLGIYLIIIRTKQLNIKYKLNKLIQDNIY